MDKTKKKYGYTTFSCSITLGILQQIHSLAAIKNRTLSEAARIIMIKGLEQINKEYEEQINSRPPVEYDEIDKFLEKDLNQEIEKKGKDDKSSKKNIKK